jgi:hypothetical protein
MSKLAKSISAVVLSGIAIAIAGSAGAANNGYSGTLCNPIDTTQASRINYSQFGVHNISAATATVECGGLPTVGSNITSVQATVYDRNSTAGQDVCCTMRVLNNDGLFIASASPCTSGFSSSSMPLNFTPPANAAGSFDMSCNIPPVLSGNFSHVTTYRITTSP